MDAGAEASRLAVALKATEQKRKVVQARTLALSAESVVVAAAATALLMAAGTGIGRLRAVPRAGAGCVCVAIVAYLLARTCAVHIQS